MRQIFLINFILGIFFGIEFPSIIIVSADWGAVSNLEIPS